MTEHYKVIDTHRQTYLIVDKACGYDIDNPVAILHKRAYLPEEAQEECDRLNRVRQEEQEALCGVLAIMHKEIKKTPCPEYS